jgi:DNA-binding transcriptional ArsR family regulator
MLMFMPAAQDIAIIGTLLGDETRAAIVAALLDGRALTARELAHGAGVTPQTASFHLSKLDGAGLLNILPQGRHRFYRLASPDIADAIEALARIAPNTNAKPAAKPSFVNVDACSRASASTGANANHILAAALVRP